MGSVIGSMGCQDALLTFFDVGVDIPGRESETVSVFADMGSMSSFISSELASRLDLRVLEGELDLVV